jgi:hypothetical protein
MRFRTLAAAVLTAAFATHGYARSLIVHVASTSCKAATLRAVAADGAAIEHRWTGADVPFDLPDGVWTIKAEAPGCWAAPATSDTEPLKMALWPAATLRFRIEEPRDVPVEIRVASADGSIAPVTIDCAREDALRTCSVPATSLDVRLGADGFVPHYVWGRDVAPRARVDLGAIRLMRGASVSGRVTVPQKQPKLDDVTVQLVPGGLVAFDGDPRRMALLTQTTKASRRGFFQFAGVSEGTYKVVARANGWSPAAEGDVRVIAGAEVALPKPLALSALARLDVVVDPVADPNGKPWRLELTPYPPTFPPAPALASTVSPAGEWSRQQLEAGIYNLTVNDSTGSMLHRQIVEVSEGMPPLRVTIESFRIRGRVVFRGEPLQCGIWLTQPTNGNGSIRLRSDKDGRFETVLPEEGLWRIQLALTKGYAYLPDIDIRRRSDGAPTDVEIVLPSGRVRGKTVDEAGEPAASSVRILRDGGAYLATIRAEDGTFDLLGVPPIDVMIHARELALDRDSGLVPHHVTEEAEEPITIVLSKRKKAKAWLSTPDGRPIAGALVRYLSAGSMKEDVTGPSGELTFPLPQNEVAVPMVILPPGLPRKMTTLAIGTEATEIVISPIAARLVLNHTPKSFWIAHENVIFSGSSLFEPSYGLRPREATSAGFLLEVEPGAYAICASRAREQCKTFLLQAGSTTTIDMTEVFR